MTTLNSINATASNIFSTLGITSWQLANGKFNGCTFCTFATNAITSNKILSSAINTPLVQGALITQEANDVSATINQIFGNINNIDANGAGNLVDTAMGLLENGEKLFPQVVVKTLPYANKVNTESLGFGGSEYSFTIIVVGQDYQQAINNIKNAILNPPTGNDKYSLFHPTLGAINGITRNTQCDILTTIDYWRASIIRLTFRTELSSQANTNKKSTIQNSANAIQGALGSILAIDSAMAAISAYIKSFSRMANGQQTIAPLTYTRLNDLQSQVGQISKNLLNCTNYVYKNTTNKSINNLFLDKTSIAYQYLPLALRIASPFNISQASIIITFYDNIIKNFIKNMQSNIIIYGGIFNNLINSSTTSVTTLFNVCEAFSINNNLISYTVPYVMSISEVLARNNISLDKAQEILANNPEIDSANHVQAGIKIIL